MTDAMTIESISPAFLIAIPVFVAFLAVANMSRPNVRDGVSIVGTIITLLATVVLYPATMRGEKLDWVLLAPIEDIAIRLTVEPLGLLFATVAAVLWIPTTLYAIGYMRTNKEEHHTQFFFCFAVSIAATMGIALAGNLLTLFIFYEMLTLATYPLVTHKRTPAAGHGGRTYLSLLLTTSIGFLLPAIIITWGVTGTLDFKPGGILQGKLDPVYLPWLIALFAFGVGKAALMPFHRWLPGAMVAPTPVSALLHAVAVVKAGVFTITKVVVYIIGIDFMAETGASEAIMWVAAFTLTAASIIAMRQDNLKARLAYSTIGQLSYVVLGAMLATAAGVYGAAMHIVMHAVGKITLFFCAGAIYVHTQKTNISQLDGLGRRMPFTFGAFFVAALCIIGLPPLGGAWSKWFLITASFETHHWVMAGALIVSSLLNIAYLLPIVSNGFFKPSPDGEAQTGIDEAPLLMVLPLCFTAGLCFLAFLFGDAIYGFVQLIPLR